MTGYDVFALLVILASAAAGWVRGGTRELITLLSFVLAAFIALISLPLTGPIGRALVNPDWAGTVFAAAASFMLIYFGIRIFGSQLSKRAQAHPQLGAIHLVVVAALPGEKTPRWLGEAMLYKLSAGSARAIQVILPGIGRGADALAPIVDSSVREGISGDDALPKSQSRPTSPPADTE